MKTKAKACVLLFGGLDPSGGAGLAVDLRVAAALHVRALPLATCIAIQNDREFHHVRAMPSEQIMAQLESVLAEPIAAVKIGALGLLSPWPALLKRLKSLNVPIVVDPVIRSSSGGLLVENASESALRETYQKHLAENALLFTPNFPEANFLLQADPQAVISRKALAMKLQKKLSTHVLLKGGHGKTSEASNEIADLLCSQGAIRAFKHEKINRDHVRGTGCALATTIAAYLALGKNLTFACSRATQHMSEWIKGATQVSEGVFHLLCETPGQK